MSWAPTRWVKRAGIVLGVLVGVDLLLRVTLGAASVPPIEDDPDTRPFFFAMPRAVEAIFVVDEEDGVFRTSPRLLRADPPWAQPQEFPAQRGPEGVRVAFLGGSSLQAVGFAPAETFAARAGAAIEAAVPGRRVDVLNLGSGPANTRQLGRIAAQLGPLRPDVLVIHTAHNDAGGLGFHEALLDASIARRRTTRRIAEASATYDLLRRLRESRAGPTADRGLFGPERDSSQLGVEVPRSVPSLSESVFLIGGPWHNEYTAPTYAAYVAEHQRLLTMMFEQSLSALVRNAHDQGTEVVLVKPAANLRSFAPAVSVHLAPDTVSRRRGKRFRALVKLARDTLRRARVAFVDDPLPLGAPAAEAACAIALPLLDEAETISDSWADLHFVRGTCLLHVDPAAAPASFARARDLSPAHAPDHRAPSALLDAVERTARAQGVPCIDLPAALAAAAGGGVPGSDLFLDNIHLNAAGHRVAGAAVAKALLDVPGVRTIPPERPADPTATEFLALLKAPKPGPKRPLPPTLVDDLERATPDPRDLKAGNLGEGDFGEPDDSVPSVGHIDAAPNDPVPTERQVAPAPDDSVPSVGHVDAPIPGGEAPSDAPPGEPEAPPVSPDALGDPEAEDRSGNVGDVDVGTPTQVDDPPPEEDWELDQPDTDRSGNLGEGDFGDPEKTNQGEGDDGPKPGD